MKNHRILECILLDVVSNQKVAVYEARRAKLPLIEKEIL